MSGSTNVALSSAASFSAACWAFPCTDTNLGGLVTLKYPRRNNSIASTSTRSSSRNSSSRSRRTVVVSCEVALGSNNPATIVADDEEEAKKIIGARVRVTAPVKVYHVPRLSEELDLFGLEGKVKLNVSLWKGKRISSNLPYKIEFFREGVKFFAHLKDDEFEFLDS